LNLRVKSKRAPVHLRGPQRVAGRAMSRED